MTRSALFSAVLLALLPVAAAAERLSDVAELDVLTGWRETSGRHIAAVRIRLAPGWKTYWRAPGDAGIPPDFTFEGAQNMTGVAWHWPIPDVFETSGMRSVGYADQVVLPVEITPGGPGQIEFAGSAQIGICKDICIPAFFEFSAILPDSGARDASIVAALVDRPMTADEAGVRGVTCRFSPLADGLRLTAKVEMAPIGDEELAVVEAGPGIWVSEPDVMRSGGTLTVGADLVGAKVLDRSDVRLTLLAGGQGVDIRGCTAG
ncbi:protein-disulfide reductase DsbD domain-containing protein [Aestuariibius insulae]|uniref:protein-disulfide reductase DsbD domain-containing protein n=1 Tax=Aestuariibius insulae TaxID=2058287 RepID=UPI00345EE54C